MSEHKPKTDKNGYAYRYYAARLLNHFVSRRGLNECEIKMALAWREYCNIIITLCVVPVRHELDVAERYFF